MNTPKIAIVLHHRGFNEKDLENLETLGFKDLVKCSNRDSFANILYFYWSKIDSAWSYLGFDTKSSLDNFPSLEEMVNFSHPGSLILDYGKSNIFSPSFNNHLDNVKTIEEADDLIEKLSKIKEKIQEETVYRVKKITEIEIGHKYLDSDFQIVEIADKTKDGLYRGFIKKGDAQDLYQGNGICMTFGHHLVARILND